MNNLLERMIKQINIRTIFKLRAIHTPARNPANNQDGSVIIIALMVLAIMTIISLMLSGSVVTENFIIRNQGIYKQNVNMTEAAMMEGFQRFMQIRPDSNNIVDVDNSGLVWVNNMHDGWASTDWYALNSSTPILDDTNSLEIDSAQNLADRGEAATGNLRCAFVGWQTVALPGGGSESLGIGSNKPVWREGRFLSEYISRSGGAYHGYGMLRMEIGVKRRIVIN
jgi:Tfp pilus assembly protein PilX